MHLSFLFSFKIMLKKSPLLLVCFRVNFCIFHELKFKRFKINGMIKKYVVKVFVVLLVLVWACGGEDAVEKIVGAARNPTPINNSINTAFDAGILSFLPGTNTPDGANYRLYLDANANPTSGNNLGNRTSFTYGDLEENTKYYWKVETLLNNEVLTSSAIWSFTTGKTLSVTNPMPVHQNRGTAINGDISFTAGRNTAENTTYKLYLDTNTEPLLSYDLGKDTSYTYGDLKKNTTYFWKVETLKDNEVLATSSIFNFTTLATQAVTNLAPSNQAVRVDLEGVLTFSPGENTAATAVYKLYLDTNANPSTSHDLGGNTRFAYSDLMGDTTYYWKVETIENDNVSAVSDVFSFETRTPINTNPAPSVNFDLSNWKLTLPVNENGDNDGKSVDIKVAELNDDYINSDYFFTSDDGGMVFRCPVKGATTSGNTSYARTELREMLRGTNTSIATQGVNRNNWVFSSASQADQTAAGAVDGRMEATLAINHVTTTGSSDQVGRAIIGQIHANDDEPIRVYYRKLPNNDNGTIYFAHEPRTGSEQWIDDLIGSRRSSADDPIDGIALDERFSYAIDVVGNTLTFTLIREGKTDIVRTVDMSNSRFDESGQYMYFKAGLYHANNSGDADDYAQVTFYRLEKSH
jgi:hypothetical protein